MIKYQNRKYVAKICIEDYRTVKLLSTMKSLVNKRLP